MRECRVIVAVGKKGVGKSVETISMIYDYVRGNPKTGAPPRKALIFDVNDEFSSFWYYGETHSIKPLAIKDIGLFSVHPTIEVRRIRPFFDDGRRMSTNDMADVLNYILANYRNGLLLVEDINKYSSDTPKRDLISALATVRHIGVDLIAHYQSIGRPANPKLLGNINMIRIHKTTDSVSRHKDKYQDSAEIMMIAEAIVRKRHKNGDERYFLYVDLDESKIRGKFTMAEVDWAIQEYISNNANTLLKPYLQAIDFNTTKAKYTKKEAIQAAFDDVKLTYFEEGMVEKKKSEKDLDNEE